MQLSAWALQENLRHMDMAALFRCSESTVSKLASGHRQPSLGMIRRIDLATAGQVSLRDWFLREQPEPGEYVYDLQELPERHFGVVYADPPWSFKTRSPKGRDRCPDKHYACMDLDAIKALPVARWAAPDCHLFLWVPFAHLLDGIVVMASWGFTYSSSGFVWVKTKRLPDDGGMFSEWDVCSNLGMTTRKGAEVCLLGRRGQPRRMSKAVKEVIVAPVRDHSRKPDEARERIMAYGQGPYLELFGRRSAHGWTTWGNERHD